MPKKISVPRGTKDILPVDIPKWRGIEAKARRIFLSYNYKEIRTPFFENTELFSRSMGKTSDVVQKQMLNLQSQGKSDADDIHTGDLSLRPEGTASIVRSYIENDLDRKENISKFFYIGPMFRGERPQKGRLRQFHQIGAEVIGPGVVSPYLDAEIIALNVNLLKAFGLADFKLKINTLGFQEDKEKFSKSLRKLLKPKLSELCGDCRQRFERNVFRVLDCKKDACQGVIKSIELNYDWLDNKSKDHFTQVKEALDSLGIEYEEVPSLVRGLDYYTHTVFEITCPSLGSQDAISAGGRYDNLVKELGGPAVPAMGFALGIERVHLAMSESRGISGRRLRAYLIALDEKSFKKAFSILNILRDKGISSDFSYKISNNTAQLNKQMSKVNKMKADFSIIIGQKELDIEAVSVKDMRKNSQKPITVKNNDYTELIGRLKERNR